MERSVDDLKQLLSILREKNPTCALIGASPYTSSALQALGVQVINITSVDHFNDSVRYAQAVVLDAASVYTHTTKTMRQMAMTLARRRTSWALCATGAMWSRSIALMAKFLQGRSPCVLVGQQRDADAVYMMGNKLLSLVRGLMRRRDDMTYIMLQDDAILCRRGMREDKYGSSEPSRLEPAIVDDVLIHITAALSALCHYYKLPLETAAALVQYARTTAHNTAPARGSFLNACIDAMCRFSSEKAVRQVTVSHADHTPL